MDYQQTGFSFQSTSELRTFVEGQGFVHHSDGWQKVCHLTGETIFASYTLTQGRVWLSILPRKRVTGVGEFIGVHRGVGVYAGKGMSAHLQAWEYDRNGDGIFIGEAMMYKPLCALIDAYREDNPNGL